MDYLVHYEDGSTGYLQHYGVKGMKWGVWNNETSARYRNGGAGDNLFRNQGERETYALQSKGSEVGRELRKKYGIKITFANQYSMSSQRREQEYAKMEKAWNDKSLKKHPSENPEFHYGLEVGLYGDDAGQDYLDLLSKRKES